MFIFHLIDEVLCVNAEVSLQSLILYMSSISQFYTGKNVVNNLLRACVLLAQTEWRYTSSQHSANKVSGYKCHCI